MKFPRPSLIVFPTELSLRRFQQEQALEKGCIDTLGHTTFARLRQQLLPYAPVKRKPLSPAAELLLRKQVIDVAKGHFVDGGPLGQLSEAALSAVLQQLVSELATLPQETGKIVDWMLSRSPKHKLYQLGMLFSIWRVTLQQEGFADALDRNKALLKLLKGNREKWPPFLRDAKQITFRSVRWFNPFEETCVMALNQKMKVKIESALPTAHAEKSGDRLGQQIRSEIMSQPWAGWTEDLSDALAVDSSDLLQLADTDRIAFSRSAGAYGEIEDLARRIAWNLQNIPANRIALVVPNIGAVQDIIPHVFSRFQIPYYFRRGRPVLSSPTVKAFVAWLAFPLHAQRDDWIDLVRNPALKFEDRETTVQSLLKMSPRLEAPPAPPISSAQDALEHLRQIVVEPEDHFNAEALNAVEAALEGLGSQKLSLRELVDLLEELLKNSTIRPRESHDQGVWILNPHDAVGLDFDLVLFAGLNEGDFPGIPQQDALLSDSERHSMRLHLQEQGCHLPQLTLPSADVLFEQQSVLFICALGMAREKLVLSCQAADQEGREKGAGEYYRKLWNLAGWCTQTAITLDAYERWRIGQLPCDNVFSHHLAQQATCDPADRLPFPGESFLPIIPLPLCRATDEALQAAVQPSGSGRTGKPAPQTKLQVKQAFQPSHPAKHLIKMLEIEAERELFLETPLDERTPSIFCGNLGNQKPRIQTWFEQQKNFSPTALEALARCPYLFFLERVVGIRDARTADDSPDPMERGGLIHTILHTLYRAFAERSNVWAVQTESGWRKRSEGGAEALPLVQFLPENAEQDLAFAEEETRRLLKEASLGHPDVWAAEQEKIVVMVLNFIRYDQENCTTENRFPALFEHPFSDLDLQGCVRVRGIIDRVDLIFAETGELKCVRVLDYKGASRARTKTDEYLAEIHANLDCQLPIYALAAQDHFFGKTNTEAVNAMTEAGYLFYQREFDKIEKELKKCLIPLDTKDLIDGFLKTLHKNIQRLKDGDFAVDPLIDSYNDFQSVCRVEAVDRSEFLETI